MLIIWIFTLIINNMEMKTFNATINDEGRTLFKFLVKSFPDVPKGKLESVFRKKDVKVNGKRLKDKRYIVKHGDEIVVYGVSSTGYSTNNPFTKIKFNVVFEDKNILVIDKPHGYPVHDAENCIDNQVLTYLRFIQKDSFRPSHIGRLDKVTSGLMVYGKTYEAVRELNDYSSKFEKVYEFKSDLNRNITTEYKIGHNELKKKEEVTENGKATKTEFIVVGKHKFAKLYTGRKHQIRVSLSKLGYPIYGDNKYGGKKADRVYLHSAQLKFQGIKGNLEYLNGQEFLSDPKWK